MPTNAFRPSSRSRKVSLLALEAIMGGVLLGQTGTITTIAGSGVSVLDDGIPATSAKLLGLVHDVSLDRQGNLYLLENGRVRRVNPSGIIATVGTATNATHIAVDSAGNVFVAEPYRVRKITPDGTASIVAGTGTPGFSGDGGNALLAQFNLIYGLAIDPAGNLFVADYNNQRVRKITPNGTITTFAGNGRAAVVGLGVPEGENGPATLASVVPWCVATDLTGNVYIGDSFHKRVRKVSTNGMIGSIAQLWPHRLTVNAAGVVHLVTTDGTNTPRQIGRLTSTGGLDLIAGNNSVVFSGDGGPALNAGITPSGIAMDSRGVLYVADGGHQRVRAIDNAGIIRTVAGGGPPSVDQDALRALLSSPGAIAVDAQGGVLFGDLNAGRVGRLDATGRITTIAGGAGTMTVDVPATSTSMPFPFALALDQRGGILVAEANSCRVRRIDPNGIIRAFAGTGTCGFGGDGGPATAAQLGQVVDVTIDALGNVYLADRGNSRIRKVAPDGTISTYAPGARTNRLSGLATDRAGNLYIADSGAHVILRVTPQGTVTTVAGNGIAGGNGDNINATNASLNTPVRLAVSTDGTLYVSENAGHRIRSISQTGIIGAVAGTGNPGYNGDGPFPARNALLNGPVGIALSLDGKTLFVADQNNNRIRKVTLGETAASTYTISGTVTGADATLTITGPNNFNKRQAVTKNERYTVTGLGSGTYTIAPAAAGFEFTPPARTIAIDSIDQSGADFVAREASSSDSACLIFVHGSLAADADVTDFAWAREWATGRDYWRSYYTIQDVLGNDPPTVSANLQDDFIRVATDDFRRPFFVVRYNGSVPYWSAEAAGLVARQIALATDGLPDLGGNSCNHRDGRLATRFWVVTHSMGATVLDYILGNGSPGDPWQDTVCSGSPDSLRHTCIQEDGLFGRVVDRVEGVFSVGGAHKGSVLSDYICQNLPCAVVGRERCTPARKWLQSDREFLVENNASSPARPVYLIGGLRVPVSLSCFGGETANDGVLQFASQFACAGDPTISYDRHTVCANDRKQGRNFFNVDAAFETHDEERNTRSVVDRRRYSIPGGLGASPSGDGSFRSEQLADHMTSAERIHDLLTNPAKLAQLRR